MRARGWIRLVGNEGNCHLVFSTHCVTPGCSMSLPLCLAHTLYSSSPPFFLSESVLHLQLCTLPFSLAIHTILPHSSPLPSFFFPPSALKRMHYFQPWLCGVDRESRTMAAFQSHDPALRGHWLLVFFSTVNSNGPMQLAYYWHPSPQR